MFRIFASQWKVTKAVTQLVIIGEEEGGLLPEMRNQTIKNVLEFTSSLGMATSRIPADEQAMIGFLAFGGLHGLKGMELYEDWVSIYARHLNMPEHVSNTCKLMATELLQRAGEPPLE